MSSAQSSSSEASEGVPLPVSTPDLETESEAQQGGKPSGMSVKKGASLKGKKSQADPKQTATPVSKQMAKSTKSTKPTPPAKNLIKAKAGSKKVQPNLSGGKGKPQSANMEDLKELTEVSIPTTVASNDTAKVSKGTPANSPDTLTNQHTQDLLLNIDTDHMAPISESAELKEELVAKETIEEATVAMETEDGQERYKYKHCSVECCMLPLLCNVRYQSMDWRVLLFYFLLYVTGCI